MEKKDSENLLSASFQLPNGVILKNKIMMAPMTICSGFYNGFITQDSIEYYRQRSKDVGTVIVECGFVADKGLAFPGAIAIDDDDKIDGLRKLAMAIKEQGAKAIIQIYHGGRMVDRKLIGGRKPIGPSAIAAPRPGFARPLKMSSKDVNIMIQKFADATRRVVEAGFDGVEIHGANTYLIQQFYSPNSNQRKDKWGGNREKRTRFPLNIVDVVKDVVAKTALKDFIIGYRFSPEELENPGIRFDDTMYLLEKIADKGLDYFHFSIGDILRSSIVDTKDSTPLITKYIKLRSEKLAQIPIVGVGGIVNKEDVERAFENGYDLIAVGKALIAYPDWLKRIAKNEKLVLQMDKNKREDLFIPEPLWTDSLIQGYVKDLSSSNKNYMPGIYREEALDNDKNLILDIDLAKDYIQNIELVNKEILNKDDMLSFSEIKERIISTNSPYVDAITGATTQSEAVKKAVGKAIAKSSKAAVIALGGDANIKETDVVIVGTGGAGLAAAIEAYDDGASVLLVEKMSVIGGNTSKASLGMNAAETKFQKNQGIKDSKELFYEETLKGGKGENNPKLLKFLVESSSQAIDWLDKLGIKLDGITASGGMSIKRAHRPITGDAVGGFLVSGLVKNINKRNIEVLLYTKVTEIIINENKLTGVKAINENNEEVTIKAKSVIIATGGFSANLELVTKYRPDLKGFVTTNHQGAKGDGIKLLQSLGVRITDMEKIQIHPSVEQNTSYLISESVRGGGGILISQKGQRFINELETRDKVSAAIMNLSEHYAYIIFDQKVRDENRAINEYVQRGIVTEADSIEKLADSLHINQEQLVKTINRYGEFVEKQYDDDFGRKTGLNHVFNKAPYYAIKVSPGVHHTMGGVEINSNTQVLNKENKTIDGVYAAGEVVGGIHGANRIGGNAIADIIIFGKEAGKNAANYALSNK